LVTSAPSCAFFVVAFVCVLKMDPFGVLLAFGARMIVCGFLYRTPILVEPMKAAGAIATTHVAQTLVIKLAMVYHPWLRLHDRRRQNDVAELVDW